MEPSSLARCLDLLCCPVTGGALSILDDRELAGANEALRAGRRVHRDSTPVKEPLTAALGSATRSQVYRVTEGIAWLLPDLALVPANETVTSVFAPEKRVVQSFYDEFGWTRNESGLFNDTALFTDTRSLAEAYRRHCNRRVGRLLQGGRALLDVASGAIPHVEYLDFSRNYDVRICVDLSIHALREARAKLGERGLYLLGDITRLPIATGAVDAVISLHTIYHVPQAEQTDAIDELVRVTKTDGRIVVVYVWDKSPAMTVIFRIRGWLGRIRKWLRREPPTAPGAGLANSPPPLYFHPQNFAWFASQVASRHRARLAVWSAINTQFQVRFLTEGAAGRLTLALVKLLEAGFPWLAGRFGQYPLFIIKKRG